MESMSLKFCSARITEFSPHLCYVSRYFKEIHPNAWTISGEFMGTLVLILRAMASLQCSLEEIKRRESGWIVIATAWGWPSSRVYHSHRFR